MSYVKALSMADEILGKIQSGQATMETRVKSGRGLVAKPTDFEAPPESPTPEPQIPFGREYSALGALEERIRLAREEEQFAEQTGGNLVAEGPVRPRARASSGMEPVPGTLNDIAAAREALAAVESRGSGDYAAIGPVVGKGAYKGQRAYGRYQVMEGNIAPWTKEVFGEAKTKEEFMADPKIQDAVVEHQLRKSYNKFGNFEDAASVWFSGQPLSKAGNRSDGYTTVPDYVKKFRGFFYDYKVKN
jgi:hypothetical protein